VNVRVTLLSYQELSRESNEVKRETKEKEGRGGPGGRVLIGRGKVREGGFPVSSQETYVLSVGERPKGRWGGGGGKQEKSAQTCQEKRRNQIK